MIEAILIALIYVCVAAAVIWIVIYVFNRVVGEPIPARVQSIIWVVFMLLALLWLLRAILPGLGVSLP